MGFPPGICVHEKRYMKFGGREIGNRQEATVTAAADSVQNVQVAQPLRSVQAVLGEEN
jgi:hypothetical protein